MKKPPATKDRCAAWDQIMEIARANALILSGAGGVVTLLHPDTQKDWGQEAKVLYMSGMGPFPRAAKEA